MEELRGAGDVLWLWGIPTRGLGIFRLDMLGGPTRSSLTVGAVGPVPSQRARAPSSLL